MLSTLCCWVSAVEGSCFAGLVRKFRTRLCPEGVECVEEMSHLVILQRCHFRVCCRTSEMVRLNRGFSQGSPRSNWRIGKFCRGLVLGDDVGEDLFRGRFVGAASMRDLRPTISPRWCRTAPWGTILARLRQPSRVEVAGIVHRSGQLPQTGQGFTTAQRSGGVDQTALTATAQPLADCRHRNSVAGSLPTSARMTTRPDQDWDSSRRMCCRFGCLRPLVPAAGSWRR